jgi:hypothetical protein
VHYTISVLGSHTNLSFSLLEVHFTTVLYLYSKILVLDCSLCSGWSLDRNHITAQERGNGDVSYWAS